MENAKAKVTKKVILNAIIAAMENAGDEIFEVDEIEVTPEDIIAYAEKTIEQLDNKAAKAAEKAAEKKAEGDEMLKAIEAVLTGEFQTGGEILKAIEADFEDATQAKVTARLTKLCKNGVAVKTDIKVDKRKIKGYALAAEVEVEEAKETEE